MLNVTGVFFAQTHLSPLFKLTHYRCLRLNKDYQPLQTTRKRKSVNRPSAAKTERLKEKLDRLYQLLQSSTPSTSIADQNGTASTAPTSIQPSPEFSQSHDFTLKDVEDFGPCSIQRTGRNHNYLRLHSPTTAPDSSYITTGTRSTTYQSSESSLISGFACLIIYLTRYARFLIFYLLQAE